VHIKSLHIIIIIIIQSNTKLAGLDVGKEAPTTTIINHHQQRRRQIPWFQSSWLVINWNHSSLPFCWQ